MKQELKKLHEILTNSGIESDEIKGVQMYLAVCFLGFNSDKVSRFFKVKYTKVRHFITLYGVKLKKEKLFLEKMHQVAKKYKLDAQLKIAV